MKPADMQAWMVDTGLSKSGACRALGIARTTLDRYISGETEIPRYIGLACAAVVLGYLPYPDIWEEGPESGPSSSRLPF